MANTDNNRKSGASKSNTAEILLPSRTSSTSSNVQRRRPVQQTQTTSRTSSAAQRRPSAQTTRKKKKKSKDAGAKVFLFCMLLIVAVLVAVICIKGAGVDLFIAATTTNSEQTQGTAANGTTANNELPVQGTAQATQPETTEPVFVPSFDNPAIVTDCNFATVVVNRNYRIPESYEDTVDLVYVCGSGQRLQREVAVHYEEMFDAAAAEGIYLTPVSGYRSYDTQVELYNNKINQMLNQGYSAEEAPIQAATIVMVPGSSEHNLGYAMDIVSLYESFDQTAEFDWLMENAEDYGFILRYPKGKEDITKVIYEPWHWRYVGVETARKINASGLTLEEYYGKSAQ